ncbi:Ohr family peroxiredoxin [Streptomyces chiangmaiensis]|uniref:Ohr family peroxiredoxin n=1 Tax=Streptomyces chiangmaiensis TaxID=766497 RepID=A0ABU7FDR3_9ACTN|nr:Ohr family peroxiredoxin [Streptomyces chiangmaiensis]MED7822049.1 Ohr family peroxiredoxin [Streptomyces chiangmaiensis]
MAATYTGVVTSTSEGRNGGRVVAEDGLLEATLAIPKELGGAGGATNPEQLFAAAWSSCFVGAVKRAATQRKVTLKGVSVEAAVTLHHDDPSEFGLSAVLKLELSGVDQRTAEELGAAAHQLCPYSKATRGNIPVTIEATAV